MTRNINLGPVRPVFKGTYSDSATYRKLDCVTYQGSLWALDGIGETETRTGVTPGTAPWVQAAQGLDPSVAASAISAKDSAVAAKAASEASQAAALASEQAAAGSAATASAKASAASGSATSASASASAASASASAASTSASSAATSATQAQASATAAAGSATACVAIVDGAVESITEGVLASDQLAAEARKVRTLQRQVANLRAAAQGQLYVDESDSDAAYAKAVPSGAMPYAALESIGGKSVVWNQLAGSRSIYKLESAANNASFRVPASTSGHTVFVRVRVTVESECENQFAINLGGNIKPNLAQLSVSSAKTISFVGVFKGASSGGYDAIYFYPNGTAAGDTAKFRLDDIMAVDLTLAGLADKTAAEIDSMFPEYIPYTEPQIASASVTKVDVQGRNLFDIQAFAEQVGGTFDTDGFLSFSPVAEYSQASLMWENTVGTPGSMTIQFTVKDRTSRGFFAMVLFADGSTTARYPWNGSTNTISFATDAAKTVKSVRCSYGSSTASIAVKDIYIGFSAEGFAPYTKSEVAIPAAIRALPGYGWSAGSVCNEVDFARKRFLRRVGSLDLGSLAWSYRSDFSVFTATVPSGMVPAPDWTHLANALCCRYALNTQKNVVNVGLDGIGIGSSTIFVRDAAFTDPAAFKAAMSGVDLYHELATPIETDISDLLPEDIEILRVEPGGTVTFVQSDSTKRLPVTSTIDYEIKTSEA